MDAERLREVLRYNPETGVFTRAASGDVAGGPHCRGYWQVSVDGTLYLAHRLAWLYTYGAWPENQIDHRNGDRRDNRLCNLREATSAENHQNLHAPRSDNTSGFLGVSRKRGGWRATIRRDGVQRNLGTFSTPEAAAAAYRAAKFDLHPYWEGAS